MQCLNVFVQKDRTKVPKATHVSGEKNLKTKMELRFEKKIVWMAWTKIWDSEHKSQEVSEGNSVFQRKCTA